MPAPVDTVRFASDPVRAGPGRRHGRPSQRQSGLSGWPRARRIALLSAALVILPGLISYVSAVTGPSNSSLGVNTVEWLRDNGARAVVNQVENWYYSLTAPSKGGPGLKSLPKQAGALVAARATHRFRLAYYRPPPIPPVIHPSLAGEGVWHPTFAGGGANPPVLITTYRPQADYPQLVAGVAWINHTATST